MWRFMYLFNCTKGYFVFVDCFLIQSFVYIYMFQDHIYFLFTILSQSVLRFKDLGI